MFNQLKTYMMDNSKDKAAFSRSKIGGEMPMVVNELVDGLLYCGFFGSLDSSRLAIIIERSLETIVATEAEYLIVDMSNVEVIDSAVAAHMAKYSDSLNVLGVKAIFCGVLPSVVQSMVNTGVTLNTFRTARNLKMALRDTLKLMRRKIVAIETAEV